MCNNFLAAFRALDALECRGAKIIGTLETMTEQVGDDMERDFIFRPKTRFEMLQFLSIRALQKHKVMS